MQVPSSSGTMSISLSALVAMAREQQPFKPIIIEGGRTQGRMLPQNQPPKRKNETVVRPLKGVDYAKKLQNLRENAKEEEVLALLFNITPYLNYFSCLFPIGYNSIEYSNHFSTSFRNYDIVSIIKWR